VPVENFRVSFFFPKPRTRGPNRLGVAGRARPEMSMGERPPAFVRLEEVLADVQDRLGLPRWGWSPRPFFCEIVFGRRLPEC